MFPEHLRTGITHDDADLFAAVLLIAMDRAFRAGRLVFAKPAAIEADADVLHELTAFVAQRAAVLIPAMDVDHGHHGLPFPREAAVCKLTFRWTYGRGARSGYGSTGGR